MKTKTEIPTLKNDFLEYKPALDIIRFLAALWVILGHADVLLGTDHGVTIFFVLSGYLVGGQLIDEKLRNGSININQFYFKRITRIWPPYFISLAIYLCIFFLRGQNSVEGFYGSMLGALTYSYNLVNDIRGHINPTWVSFNQIWSLSIEEQFYIIAPLFITLCPPILIFPLTFALMIFFYNVSHLYTGLFIGILIAQLLRNISLSKTSDQLSLIATTLSIGIFAVLLYFGQFESFSHITIYSLSALLIGVSSFIKINPKYHSFVRNIGLMTYSSYLLHGLPVYFLSPIYRWVFEVHQTPVWFKFLCGISTFILSYFFLKIIELPIIERRNKMLKNKSPLIELSAFLACGLAIAGLFVLLGVMKFPY